MLTAYGKKWITFILCIAGVVIFFRYLFSLCWPIVIAFLLVAPHYDLLLKIQHKTHIGRGILTGGILVLLCLAGIILVCIVGSKGMASVMDFIGDMDRMQLVRSNAFHGCCRWIADVSGMQIQVIEQFVDQGVGKVAIQVQDTMLPKLMDQSVVYVKVCISFFAVFVITVIMTVLLAKEYGQWRRLFYRIPISRAVSHILLRLKKMAKVYLKAQGIILSVIMVISGIGVWISGSEHFVLLGLLTGMLDVLPFIGTGIVLLPLCVWNLIQSRFLQAVVLLVTYGLCAIAREMLEPRLIAGGLNLSPVGILLSIFVGLKLYGVLGVLFGPVSLLIVYEMYKEIFEKDATAD